MDNKDEFNKHLSKLISCVAWVAGIAILIFIVVPYLLAVFMPLIGKNDEYEYLVSFIDGAALLVGITGTIASIASIIMTISDHSRYKQERKETELLYKNVENLHYKLQLTNEYVKQTFEQNQRLALELYNNNIIKNNPNVKLYIYDEQQNSWQNKDDAKEVIN